MNPTRPNQSCPDLNQGPVLGAPAFRRRTDSELAGRTPALPGNTLRFRDASYGFRKITLLAGLLALALTNGLKAAAQPTNAPAGNDYSSFRIIAERNIFDPNRYPHTTRTVRRTASNRAPAFSLVGTMTYKRGMLAFFDGTDSDSRRILATNGVINGYTVADITLRGVRLESAGKAVEMKVGAQMRQEGKGEWQLVESGESPAYKAGTGSAAPETPPPSADSSSEGNDVLKKLMQQREQELK
jgi:hypothetical protein